MLRGPERPRRQAQVHKTVLYWQEAALPATCGDGRRAVVVVARLPARQTPHLREARGRGAAGEGPRAREGSEAEGTLLRTAPDLLEYLRVLEYLPALGGASRGAALAAPGHERPQRRSRRRPSPPPYAPRRRPLLNRFDEPLRPQPTQCRAKLVVCEGPTLPIRADR